jgi:OOP family OmpA-OmpF porin
MSIVMVSCAAQKAQMPAAKAPEGPFVPKKFDLEQYGQKVENFLILFDASFSMRANYGKESKFAQAKEFVSRMNQTLPELNFTAGLRSFGHHPSVSSKDSDLIYGLTKYTKEGLDGALTALKYPGGKTPMAEGMDAAAKDLESTKGKIAVIIISDGEKDLLEKDPVSAAEAMKQTYGDRLCIYTVMVGNVSESRDPMAKFNRWLVGDKPTGKVLMDKIAETGKCGFSVNASDQMSGQAMADFVEKVFLDKHKDSDGDGVWDHLDQCPDTPKGVTVDEKGCPVKLLKPAAPKPMDSDGDGVTNDIDQCPRTPAGAVVDERGCWVIRTIQFDFDKYDIKEEYYPRLNKVAEVMRQNPGLKVEIAGHTDSMGSAQYNQTLSEKRARAVTEYLVGKGISSDRLRPVGRGEDMPIASNDTKAGQAKNRRVELTPIEF